MTKKKKAHKTPNFTQYLNDDEHILWTGKPDRWIMGRGKDHYHKEQGYSVLLILLIPTALCMGTLILPIIFLLCVGPPLIAIGLIFLPFVSAEDLRHSEEDKLTVYAVTTHRVLLLRTKYGEKLEPINIASLNNIRVGQNRLVFNIRGRNNSYTNKLEKYAIGFFGLTHEEVQHVHQLILEQQAQLKAQNDE